MVHGHTYRVGRQARIRNVPVDKLDIGCFIKTNDARIAWKITKGFHSKYWGDQECSCCSVSGDDESVSGFQEHVYIYNT